MSISKNELVAARQAWGEGLVEISQTFDESGINATKETATKIIENLYGYNLGPVLFKPTLSGGEQTFRTTAKGALSYFVGDDDEYPNDVGFALRSWCEVTSCEAAYFIEGDVAMWMGHIYCKDNSGNVTTVDKSFGYKKDNESKMRIILHHSSLPYQSS